MDSRQQFEEWVVGRKVVKKHGAKLNTNSDGTYCDYRINDRWLAWKASRESVPIDLPEITEKNIDFALNCHMEDPTYDEESGFYSGVSWCVAFLKQEIAKRNRK